MNRRQRRLRAAHERKVAPVLARQERVLDEAKESLDELRRREEHLVQFGVEKHQVAVVERKLENAMAHAKRSARRGRELLRNLGGTPVMGGEFHSAEKETLRRLEAGGRYALEHPTAIRVPSSTATSLVGADELAAARVHDKIPIPEESAQRAFAITKEIRELSKSVRDFDGLLAAWGSAIWEIAHHAPDYDAECRLMIADARAGGATGYLIPEAMMFSAVWAVDAFQRITTTHTFAAALMCSDPDRGALEGIEKQWRAFMIMVPDKLLVTRGVLENGEPFEWECTRILVSVDDASAKMIQCFPLTATQPVVAFEPMQAPTFADLLLDDPATMTSKSSSSETHRYRESRERDHRRTRLVQRLVAGLLLAMQNTENFKEQSVTAKRSANKRTPGAPEHRHIHVGRPLNIDLRPNVEEYLRTGKTGKRHGGPPTVQVLVRGHYRRQVCGIGRLQRKVMWISPFWRGPEEAIINVRPKLKAGG